MADLGVLRTGKLALDEGLITPEQYNAITVAFVKSQQVKAGLDTGFLTQQEFEGTREAFLHSLAIGSGVSAAPRPLAPAAPVSNGPTQAVQVVGSRQSSVIEPPKAIVRPAVQAAGSRQSSVIEPVRPARPSPQPDTQSFHPTPAAPSAPPKLEKRSSGPTAGGGIVAVDISTLPKLAKVDVAGKKSMAGISVSEDCLQLYNNMKTKSTFKWATFKINDAGQEVIMENVGSPQSTYDDFVGALPDNLCRYGVYDYLYTKNDTNTTIQKVVFINWCLSKVLNLPDYLFDARSSIKLDYCTYALEFAKSMGFSPQRACSMVQIALNILEVCVAGGNFEEAQASLRAQLLALTTPQPAEDDVTFSPDQVSKIAKFLVQTLFRHYTLYSFVFTQLQEHLHHTAELLVEEPKMQALETALPQTEYEAYLKQIADEEEAARVAAEEAERARLEAEQKAMKEAMEQEAAERRRAELEKRPSTLEEAIGHVVACCVEEEKVRLAGVYKQKEEVYLGRITELQAQLAALTPPPAPVTAGAATSVPSATARRP